MSSEYAQIKSQDELDELITNIIYEEDAYIHEIHSLTQIGTYSNPDVQMFIHTAHETHPVIELIFVNCKMLSVGFNSPLKIHGKVLHYNMTVEIYFSNTFSPYNPDLTARALYYRYLDDDINTRDHYGVAEALKKVNISFDP
ncbi:MAG: hypothetical protein RLP44_05530 [Aggregatilineales bacterium]